MIPDLQSATKPETSGSAPYQTKVLVLGSSPSGRAGGAESGGLIHRLAPVSVTVLAIALLAYNVYVWLEARTRLVGDPAASYDALTRLVALGAVARSEVLCADGSLVPVEYSLGRAGEGRNCLYTAVIHDLSDRVKAEERLQLFRDGLEVTNRQLEEANAQLEEVSRLKSEFLANTSHELRTPLNGIMGFLQLVLDGMYDSKEEHQEFLNQALQCSRHLLGLINDVLDIAKIEAGRLNLTIEPVRVTAVFEEVLTVMRVQAQQKG